MFFIIIFTYLKYLDIQVPNDHWVLSRLVPCIKCTELACLVLHGYFGMMMKNRCFLEYFGFRHKLFFCIWKSKPLIVQKNTISYFFLIKIGNLNLFPLPLKVIHWKWPGANAHRFIDIHKALKRAKKVICCCVVFTKMGWNHFWRRILTGCFTLKCFF